MGGKSRTQALPPAGKWINASEVNARAQYDNAIAARAGDAPEVSGVDVYIRIVPLWSIERVNRIGSELEIDVFSNLDPLDQTDVQPERAGAVKIKLRQRAELSRRRVDEQQLARRVGDSQQRTAALQALRGCHTGDRWVLHLFQAVEVNNAVVYFLRLAGVGRE